MMKLTVLYTPPTHVEDFEAHYTSVHMPLVEKMPGLVRAETSVVVGMPDGSPAPYYRMAELYFDSGDAMGEAFASDAGKQTAKDAQELASRTGSTVTMLLNVLD
jgi:uncharacterized protein (TIGR02118 family)